MSGSGAQSFVWIFWSVLIVGAVLSGIGLWRSVARFRQWKRISTDLEGEIVLGDQALHAGQPVRVYRNDSEASAGEVLCGQIQEIQNKTLTLTLETPVSPRRADSEERPRPGPPLGATVVVVVTGETALYRFSARVGDIRTDPRKEGQSHLILPRPIWLERIQRRQHVRVALAIPATFERAEEIAMEADPPEPAKAIPLAAMLPLHATILDLSGGGLRAEVGRAMGVQEAARLVDAFVPGTLVSVRLPLPALSECRLLARVRTCERAAVRGGLGVRLACQFLPMPSWEQELLIRHVFRVQQDHLKERFRPSAPASAA